MKPEKRIISVRDLKIPQLYTSTDLTAGRKRYRNRCYIRAALIVLIVSLGLCVFRLDGLVDKERDKQQAYHSIIESYINGVPLSASPEPQNRESEHIRDTGEWKPYGVIERGDPGKEKYTKKTAMGNVEIDYSNRSKGIIYISIDTADPERFRVLLSKKNDNLYLDDSQSFKPDVTRAYSEGFYPLIRGSGKYTVEVFHRDSPNSSQYKTIASVSFKAKFNEDEPWKYSNVDSRYSEDSFVAYAAHEITKGIKPGNDKAKLLKLVNYICDNYEYDYDLHEISSYMTPYQLLKVQLLKTDEYLKWGKGVCFHYTAILNAMCKSIGIPAREARGYSKSGDYHSWSQVKIGDKWTSVDLTITDSLRMSGVLPLENGDIYKAADCTADEFSLR